MLALYLMYVYIQYIIILWECLVVVKFGEMLE